MKDYLHEIALEKLAGAVTTTTIRTTTKKPSKALKWGKRAAIGLGAAYAATKGHQAYKKGGVAWDKIKKELQRRSANK